MRAEDVERITAEHRARWHDRVLAGSLYDMGFPADDAPAVIEAALSHVEACSGGPIVLDVFAEMAVSLFIEGMLVGIALGREDARRPS